MTCQAFLQFLNEMSDQKDCSIGNKSFRKQVVWCCICGYVHVKCSGLSTTREWTQDFVCQYCIRPSENGTTQPGENQRTEPEAPLENTDPSPMYFWGRTIEQHCQPLKRIFLEVVHWKPKFITPKGNSIVIAKKINNKTVMEKHPHRKQQSKAT